MKKIGKKLHRIFSFAMGVILVVETINCAGLTVHASEDSVGAAEAIVMDQELAEVVDAAEKADEAAYNAAQAAETAKQAAENLAEKAGEAALEVAEDGSYTQEVEGEDGTTTQEPVLKEEIDTAITNAETNVDTANTEIAEIEKDTKEDLQEIVEGTETATADKLTAAEEAADAAEAAKAKAEAAKQKAESADNQFAAEQAAKEAIEAALEAQAAAESANQAYEDAQDILDKALQAYEDAVAAAELSVKNSEAQKAAQEALDSAQAALDTAKAAVEAAKTEYDAAMADNATAQAAADEAAKQAGIAGEAADQTIDNLEEKKDVDVEALKEEKAVKEQELEAAKAALETTNAEQDEIIAEAQTKKDAADAEIKRYDEAQKKIKEMEKGTGAFGRGDSQIEAAQKVADKTTDDVKKTEWVRDGWKWKEVKIYYTQSEIDAAKAVVDEYNMAKDTLKNINLAEQQNISATAKSDIATAEATKAAAAQAITDKTTEVSDITTSIAAIEDYIYSDKDTEVAYMDKAQQEAYQELLSQAGVTFDAYVEIKEDTDKYIEATKDVNWKDWLGGIFTGETWENWFNELDLEAKYHGWKTTNGTYIIIQNDKDNTQALITIRDDKAYIATIDEAEFATYSATFDAVAASQAANKAAEAAAAEKVALDKYNAALEALADAQARLDAARLNKLNIEEAAKALSIAKQNVEKTEAALKRAQTAAEEATKAALDAIDEVDKKPITVEYYILNRGLVQPDESPVTSYPKGNYSTASVTGELVNGAENESGEFVSYAPIYKKGVIGEAVYNYLKVQPTTEQINEILGAGNELKDGESVTWYVIKTEGDGYHVDGIISGQKFNITVRFGYTDEETNEFVDLADSKTVKVGLGESYRVDSVAIDEYVAETAFVEGVATKDDTLYVEYTKEETRTVTINYYRGSVAGTLLGTQELQVAKSKVEAYASTIRTNWLDLKKPGDCNSGELMSYVVTEDSAVANVVYTPIPVTPVVPTPDDDDPEPETTVTTVEVPTTVANAATTPAAPTTVQTQNVVAPAEPTVIDEEQTPLAPAINDDNQNGNGGSKEQEVVEIEEEEAPLAAPGNCWIHWLILLLTVVYTVYELIRCIARNNKINKLQDNAEQAEA
ncbi:HlyD family secretion protein [Waltera intestinalis]|uniref:Uncharacterized protein n=1 Tax=Waltera intestinalis TaxID=2606635 RepID=A0A6L5YKY1_9FIRM|nr:hypothetical protein [Waltera intestinalis]MST58317.1 hypothetical protein [Waltera intestinalis]